MKIKVGALQTCQVQGDPDKTIQKALDWLDTAAAKGVQLAVFPEIYYPGYDFILAVKSGHKYYGKYPADFGALAELIPGKTTEIIGEKARQHNMHVVFTLLEKSRDGNRFHSASVLLDSKGEVLNVHRKTILTPLVETPELTPGNEFNVTETEIGKIGQLICADASCPETARILAIKGAEIICLSMGGFRIMVQGREVMDTIMEFSHASKSRAVDNSVFYIVANLIGHGGSLEFFGKSRIINYIGDVLAMGSEGIDKEELITAEFDLGELKTLPLKLISRRRPEIYGEILLPNPEAKGVSGDFLMSENK